MGKEMSTTDCKTDLANPKIMIFRNFSMMSNIHRLKMLKEAIYEIMLQLFWFELEMFNMISNVSMKVVCFFVSVPNSQWLYY